MRQSIASVFTMPARATNIKSASSVGTQQVMTPKKKASSSILTIKMNEEQIQQIAYLVAQEGKTWDECTWMLAENELRYGAACALPKSEFKYGGLPNQVKVIPSHVCIDPKQEDVQKLAFEISQRGPSLQDLHWFIAQRKFIANNIAKS